MSTKLSNKIIKIGEFMYRVYPYTEGTDLEMGNAYTFGGSKGNLILTYPYVFPYLGKYKKDSSQVGIYYKNDKLFVIHPETEAQRRSHSVSRLFEITPETIKTQLDKYLNEVTMGDLKTAGPTFEPEIKDTDDVGIKAVRLAIIAKHIDLGPYLSKLEKNWDRANTKKALERDESLTFFKLNQYANLFDFDFGLILFDRSIARDPMSRTGKAMVVFNNEPVPIDADDIEIINSIDDLKKLNRG